MSEPEIDTMRRTKVMIVTRKGSFIPATLKKYYIPPVSWPHLASNDADVVKLTVE